MKLRVGISGLVVFALFSASVQLKHAVGQCGSCTIAWDAIAGQWYESSPCANPALCYCPVPVVDPPSPPPIDPQRIVCIDVNSISVASEREFTIDLSTNFSGSQADYRYKFRIAAGISKFSMKEFRVGPSPGKWLITAHFDENQNVNPPTQAPVINLPTGPIDVDILHIKPFNVAKKKFFHTEVKTSSQIKFGHWTLDIARVF